MDSQFKERLTFLSEDSVKSLEDEGVTNDDIFKALKKPQHIMKLLDYMTVGQHAMLLEAWETQVNVKRPSVSLSRTSSVSPGFSVGSDPRSPSPSPSYYSPSYKPSYTAGASNFDGLFKPSLQTAVASRLQRAVQPATNDISPETSGASSLKELAEAYKKRALLKLRKSGQPRSSGGLSMLIILGGMIYDPDLEKGIRKKCLPEPNPTKIEVPKHASLSEIFSKARELYFKDDLGDEGFSFKLADSGGTPIHINHPDNWNVGDFYQQNGPSRYKLYVMMVFSTTESLDLDVEAEDVPRSKMTHTETVLDNCIDCDKQFRTYIPDTVCHLPDGGIVSYADPQLKCPVCDDNGYGQFMNRDLFPEQGWN